MNAIIAQVSHVPTVTPPGSAVASVPIQGGLGVALTGIVLGLCLPAFLTFMLKARARSWLASKTSNQNILTYTSKGLTALFGVVAGVYELWKKTTFSSCDLNQGVIYLACSSMIAGSLLLDWLVTTSKEDDKKKLNDAIAKHTQEKATLDRTIHDAKAEIATNTVLFAEAQKTTIRQRDEAITVISILGAVVSAKKKRIESGGDLSKSSVSRLQEVFDPALQMLTLMRNLHQVFLTKLTKPECRIRIGIYQREDEDMNQFTPVYSWDGEKTDCFKTDRRKFMRLDSPGGHQSLVVACFKSNEPLVMVEDCQEANKSGNFEFFDPDQKSRIRSMAAYRHIYDRKGRKDAFIFTIDSDEAGFFSQRMQFSTRLLLEEFCKRVEFEFVLLNFLKSLDSVSKNAPHN